MSNDNNFEAQSQPITAKEWKIRRKKRKEKMKEWKTKEQIGKLEKAKNEAKKAKMEAEKSEKINPNARSWTVSIALPGSILSNAQTPELQSYLAGQIARAATVFNIDEIVVFDETGAMKQTTDYNVKLGRILQYLECPQYLRKALFPVHNDLKFAGLLNPLDSPHHLRATDQSLYREGVTVDQPSKSGKGSLADVGLSKLCQLDRKLSPRMRVTVRFTEEDLAKLGQHKKLPGRVVGPREPTIKEGLYWGYSIRMASSITKVFSECPYKDGYDVTIGTSERGTNVDDFALATPFKHCLVVFGGVQGLESAIDVDEECSDEDPAGLFAYYLNTCPRQGSRTIRTEEAILVTLAALRPKFTAVF